MNFFGIRSFWLFQTDFFMAAATAGVFFGLRFRHRAGAGGTGHIRHAAGFADGICADFVGHRGWWLAGMSALSFVAGIKICGDTQRALGQQDYGGIVRDEMVAMMLVLAFVPFYWGWWLAAFAVVSVFLTR